MIPYGRQTIEDDDVEAVVRVLKSDWLTQGPAVESFERALADAVGAKHAVAFSNGMVALMASFFVAGLKDGDEFITTPITFAATSNAGVWFGATPVFVDVDPRTSNIDPDLIEAAITPRTKAIVPVDYAGHPADMLRIMEIAKAHGLIVIEDGCHALGAAIHGRKVGSIADLTAFSFHPVKPITTGEGGAVTTDDPGHAERLRLFRNHGITKEHLGTPSPGAWYYEMQALGVNGRLTDFQCALGTSQLKKLERFIEARRAIAARYREAFADHPSIELPQELEDVRCGWHIYPIRLRGAWAGRRAEAFAKLRDAGIGVQVHYIPVHRLPYYAGRGDAVGACPKAEAFSEAEISLPIFPTLSEEDQQTVISTLRGILA
ncbi:MAG: UDP-4-amino-4,6-dideoxy-N-acetyl-beta-L-altrosamine transaminase [Patescibacteria group bacterium]